MHSVSLDGRNNVGFGPSIDLRPGIAREMFGLWPKKRWEFWESIWSVSQHSAQRTQNECGECAECKNGGSDLKAFRWPLEVLHPAIAPSR